jgi:hypothetical protein
MERGYSALRRVVKLTLTGKSPSFGEQGGSSAGATDTTVAPVP